MNNLLKKSFYSKLDLNKGILNLGSKIYLDAGWIYCNIEYENFCIDIRRISSSLLKEDEFEIMVKDYKNIVESHFSGSSYAIVFKEICGRSSILESMQKAIDYGHKRFNRLRAFL
jgi:hypothetical protein